MKTKDEIRLEAFKQIQYMLEYSNPDSAHDALDIFAMMIQCGAETLAAACSRKQAADGLRSVADYIETSDQLPNITFDSNRQRVQP